VAARGVQPRLAQVFQRYGLPARINADNGAPWGSPRRAGQSLSELSVWLIRLGIRVSPIIYPAVLPPVEYPAGDTVAFVAWNGEVYFKGNQLRVSSALVKLPIAFRADAEREDCYDVFFCHQRFMHLDLNALKAAS
jgi:hypothetical protein